MIKNYCIIAPEIIWCLLWYSINSNPLMLQKFKLGKNTKLNSMLPNLTYIEFAYSANIWLLYYFIPSNLGVGTDLYLGYFG